MKREDQAKVYDTKKSVWIMDPKTHAYKEGLLEVWFKYHHHHHQN